MFLIVQFTKTLFSKLESLHCKNGFGDLVAPSFEQ